MGPGGQKKSLSFENAKMNCTPLTAGSGAASLRRRGGYGDGQGDALPLISCSQAATLRLGGGYGNFSSGSWERGFANEIRAWERSFAIAT